jgi:TPR repeat protein
MKTYTWKEAFEDSYEAANAGNPRAQNFVGYCYGEGRGVRRSYTLARKWYEKAARRGHKDAIFNLVLMNDRGAGGKRNANVRSLSIRRARCWAIYSHKRIWLSGCSMGTACARTLRLASIGCDARRDGAIRKHSTTSESLMRTEITFD